LDPVLVQQHASQNLSMQYRLYDCDADGGGNVPYEIRRRLHSLQKKSGIAEKQRNVSHDGVADEGDVHRVLEGKSLSVGAADVCPDTGELIVRGDEEEEELSRPTEKCGRRTEF
jgi:hypothetical protein